jgi:DamX protein
MPDFNIPPARSDDPFSSTNYQYFFTPELTQRVNLIRHLIQNSEQLLFVLAETGSGKTALLNQLKQISEKKDEHWWTYTLISNPALSPDTLISTILTAFNVRQEGKSIQELLENLRSHISSTRYNGQLPVIFVDDAHKLPLASLKLMMELAMQNEPLTRMRVVLFCEPQMTSILAAPEFEIVQQNMTHTLDIPAFTATQVRDYLQFRLQDSEYTNIHPFSGELIKKIYIESEGIPAEINLYARQNLQKFVEQRQDPTVLQSLSYPKLVWGIPVVLLLLMSITWFVYWQYTKPIETQPSVEQPTPTLFTASPETPTDLSSYVGETSPKDLNPSSQSDQKPSDQKPAVPNAQFTLPEKIGQTEVKKEDWLRVQNSNAYTLQILGVHERLTLQTFITKYQLKKVAMFKTTYRNKDWYVLAYGIYPTRSEAEAAIAKLPASLRKNTQPWVRSLGSIQKLIK